MRASSVTQGSRVKGVLRQAARPLFRGDRLASTLWKAAVLLLFICASNAKAACSFVSVSAGGFYTSFSDGSDAYGYVLPAGGTGTFTLTFTSAGCSWQLYNDGATNTSGVSFNPPSLTGTNTGTTVNLTVNVSSAAAAGVTTGSRTAQWFILVNGQTRGTVNIEQNSSSCTISFSPSSVSVSGAGGTGGINEVMPYGCWFAYSFAPPGETWFSGNYAGYPMDGAHPISNGLPLGYAVGANQTNTLRSATLNVVQPNVATFTVNQAAGTATTVTLIATPPSITVTSPLNGPDISQTINFTSSSSSTPINITNVTDSPTATWDFGTWTAGPTPSSMPIVFSSAGLSIGTYTDTFVVTSSASNTPLNIPVTYHIVQPSGPPSLGVIPSTPITNGSAQIGTQVNLTPTPISLTSSNSTPVNFSVTTQTNNSIGPNWLTVSLGTNGGSGATSISGTTPASLTVFANLQGFAPSPSGTTYTGTVTITPTSSSTSGPQIIHVTLTATGVDSLQLKWNPTSSTAQTMPLTSAGQSGIVQVSSQNTAIAPLYFTASPTVISPAGGAWLQVSPMGMQQTNATVTVSVQPSGLANSTYQGKIDFIDTSGTVEATILVTFNVTLPTLIAVPPSLTLSAPPGGAITPQTINLMSSSTSIPVVLQNLSDSGASWVLVTASGTPASGGASTTPGSLGLTFNTAGMTQGTYQDTITVTSSASNSPLSVPVTLSISGPSTQTISHVADGGGWQTTMVLVNMDTQPAQYTVNFWDESGLSVAEPLALGSATGVIAVGGAQTITTAGVAKNLTEGWAEVVSSQKIGGTAIFREVTQVQEAAVPLLTGGSSRLEIPFDSGGQFAIGVAVVNPSQTSAAQIAMTMRNEQGIVIPMTTTNASGTYSTAAVTSLTLAAHSHQAFNAKPLNATGEVRGVIEFDSPNLPVLALGIRSANNQAFTSISAVTQQPAGTKTISHIADGGGWQTTINLVNTDTQPAQYTVNFWTESGAALAVPLALGSVSGTIAQGGAQTITTAGSGNSLIEGWAEVVSNQQLGGTAIFREVSQIQEAAVPLLTSGGSKVAVPFTSGGQFAIGVALVNPSQTTTAQISVTMRDELGNTIPMTITDSHGNYSTAPVNSLTLGAHSHQAFNAKPLNATGEVRGVIEFDSPSVPIFALGIRSVNNQAFTSIQALNQ